MTNREKIILILIIALAFALRFYRLSQNPPSLTWDEAAIGYNAFSILKTLRDEHGRFLPINYFTSFGDYKPPLAIYAAILPTAVFGLNEFSTRFPSAFFGALTVLVTYFLVRELFLPSRLRPTSEESKPTSQEGLRFTDFSVICSLLSVFLLAISPWHILLSRAAFEANIATFFVVLGTYFFVKAMKEKGPLLLLSVICYLLSVYTFNTPRLFLPLFLIGLAIIYKDDLLKIKRWVIMGVLLGLLIIVPLLPHLLSPEGQLRFKEVNIFTNLEVIKTANRRIEVEGGSLLARMIHNRRVGFVLLFAKHYFDHFNPGYLFFHGDVNPKFSTQDVGQLYLIEAPFLALGIYYLLKFGKEGFWLVLWWLFAGLIPAGTARETPHALRTLVTLPTWQIIIAAGILGIYQGLQSKKLKRAFYLLSVICYLLSVFYFLHNYFVHYPKEFSREWQYGYKEAALYTQKISKNYDKVLVSHVYGRPYIYFLYYLKYPPIRYQKEAMRERNLFGQYTVKGFDKFRFGSLTQLVRETKDGRVLLIGRPEEVPGKAKVLKEIEFLDGETSFLIAER